MTSVPKACSRLFVLCNLRKASLHPNDTAPADGCPPLWPLTTHV
jgi:hypothetical protein